IPTYLDDPFKSERLVSCIDLHSDLEMSGSSNGSSERAYQTKSTKDATNAPLVLVYIGQEHGSFFFRQELTNCTGIRSGHAWIDGRPGGRSGNRRDDGRRH